MNELKIYRHYGHKSFDPKSFEKIKELKHDPYIQKPLNGFWASDRFADFGWSYWCDQEKYGDINSLKEKGEYFDFTLKPEAKVYTIDSEDKYKEFEKLYDKSYEKLAEEYDAVEVVVSDDTKLLKLMPGWDCDSICIFNPDIMGDSIKEIEFANRPKPKDADKWFSYKNLDPLYGYLLEDEETFYINSTVSAYIIDDKTCVWSDFFKDYKDLVDVEKVKKIIIGKNIGEIETDSLMPFYRAEEITFKSDKVKAIPSDSLPLSIERVYFLPEKMSGKSWIELGPYAFADSGVEQVVFPEYTPGVIGFQSLLNTKIRHFCVPNEITFHMNSIWECKNLKHVLIERDAKIVVDDVEGAFISPDTNYVYVGTAAELKKHLSPEDGVSKDMVNAVYNHFFFCKENYKDLENIINDKNIAKFEQYIATEEINLETARRIYSKLEKEYQEDFYGEHKIDDMIFYDAAKGMINGIITDPDPSIDKILYYEHSKDER